MTIILKLVTQRASGGAIERVRRLDQPTLLIGRGADCDIHLQDLSVGLEHARLVQLDARRVKVTGVAGQSFQANGRFVKEATLNLADRPVLGFGDYRLALSAGPDPGDLEITVSRETEAGAVGRVDEELRSLAPESAGIDKRALAWTLASLILVLCLAVPTVAFFLHQNATLHSDQQWSAGKLSKAHAFLEKDCKSCHQQAFVSVRDEACLSCHRAGTPLAEQLSTAARVHSWGGETPLKRIRDHADHARLLRSAPLPNDWGGRIKVSVERAFGHEETRCVGCHREHATASAKAPLVGDPARSDPAGPTLVMVQDCAGCHSQLKARLSDTTLIDTPDWNRHPDFRPLVSVAPGAPQPTARLSATSPWIEKSGLTFSHQIHLLPTGAVARYGQVLGAAKGYGGALTCASCHRADATGKAFQPVSMERDCKACHALAFPGANGQPVPLEHHHPDKAIATIRAYYGQDSARAVSTIRHLFEPGGACADCHVTRAPTAGDPTAFTVAPVRLTNRYLPDGGFDHSVPQHRKAADGHEICADCHKTATSDHSGPVLLPHISECRTCHGKTPAQTPAAAAADCAECHSYHLPGAGGRPLDKSKPWPPVLPANVAALAVHFQRP